MHSRSGRPAMSSTMADGSDRPLADAPAWFRRSKLEQGSEVSVCDLSLRLQHDLDAATFSIAELFVEVRPILKPALVSDHEGGIDLAISDALKQ